MKKILLAIGLAMGMSANAGHWEVQSFINGLALSITNTAQSTGSQIWSNKLTWYCGYDGIWRQSYTSNYLGWTNYGTSYYGAATNAQNTYGFNFNFGEWTNTIKTYNSYNQLAPFAWNDVNVYPDANGNFNTNAFIMISLTPCPLDTTSGTNTLQLWVAPVVDGIAVINTNLTAYAGGSSMFQFVAAPMTGATNLTFVWPVASPLYGKISPCTGLRVQAINISSDVIANGTTNWIVRALKYIQWIP